MDRLSQAQQPNSEEINLAELNLWDSYDNSPTEYHYSHAKLPQYTLRVKDLPSEERPRDRLIRNGAKNLSTGELLSILLGTGQGAGKLSAVGLGQHILQLLSDGQRDPLERLREMTARELMAIDGVGEAKATTILAAVELGKRLFLSRPPDRTKIDDPAIAASVLSKDLMWQTQEKFAVLLLDVKNQLMGSQVITIGTATETIAQPRDVFREVIRHGATRVIVAHNHPTGSIEPSAEDLLLTRQLLQSGQILNIPVLDHLILGNGQHQSLRQTTNLWRDFPQEGDQGQ